MLKIAAALAVIAPFLAADKKPEDVRKALIAADKKAKDKDEIEENDQPPAQDADVDAREKACDEREEAMDAFEEKADKDKSDKDAKDRKSARDARKGARDSRKGARDARAKDRNDDPENTNDENVQVGDPSTPGGNRGGKPAMDSATVTKIVTDAVQAERDLNAARIAVQPVLGVVTMDSAEAIYRAALVKLGVDSTAHASALPAIYKLAVDRAAALTPTPSGALDSAGVKSISEIIPSYGRLK